MLFLLKVYQFTRLTYSGEVEYSEDAKLLSKQSTVQRKET